MKLFPSSTSTRLLRWCAAGVAFAVGLTAIPLPSARGVTIDLVTVGDVGNAGITNNSRVTGSVGYTFQMGKFEITKQQYVDFLNAKAKTDPYGLWNSGMAATSGNNQRQYGITRSGASGSYVYAAVGPLGFAPAGANSAGNRPVSLVSWLDGARFCNWMHNGQGNGDTETGSYTLAGAGSTNTVVRNPGATWVMPTEDEWFKAAYYKGGGTNAGYWNYAYGSNTGPNVTSLSVAGTATNGANFAAPGDAYYLVTGSAFSGNNQNYFTNVGYFANAVSPYGTFDQAGNVWEILTGTNGTSAGIPVIRGGNAMNGNNTDNNSRFSFTSSTTEEYNSGFRIAYVPEPSTLLLTACCGLGLAGVRAFRLGRRRQDS